MRATGGVDPRVAIDVGPAASVLAAATVAAVSAAAHVPERRPVPTAARAQGAASQAAGLVLGLALNPAREATASRPESAAIAAANAQAAMPSASPPADARHGQVLRHAANRAVGSVVRRGGVATRQRVSAARGPAVRHAPRKRRRAATGIPMPNRPGARAPPK
jgi:hypothetical protein